MKDVCVRIHVNAHILSDLLAYTEM